jgi:hypothetical protein
MSTSSSFFSSSAPLKLTVADVVLEKITPTCGVPGVSVLINGKNLLAPVGWCCAWHGNTAGTVTRELKVINRIMESSTTQIMFIIPNDCPFDTRLLIYPFDPTISGAYQLPTLISLSLGFTTIRPPTITSFRRFHPKRWVYITGTGFAEGATVYISDR